MVMNQRNDFGLCGKILKFHYEEIDGRRVKVIDKRLVESASLLKKDRGQEQEEDSGNGKEA